MTQWIPFKSRLGITHLLNHSIVETDYETMASFGYYSDFHSGGLLKQQQTNQAGQASATLLQSLFDAAGVGIAVEDLQGRPLFVNPALCAMLGFTEEELRTKHCVEFSPPEDANKDWALFEQLRQGLIDSYRLDKRFFRKDGTLIWGRLSISSMRDSSVGPSPLVVAIVEDITEKKLAEAALRESEERFRLVANTAPVVIWMSDVNKRCTYFNQRWAEFTGRPLESGLGNGWMEDVHPEDLPRCLDTYAHAFAQHRPFQMENRIRRHDGAYRWILASGVPRFNPDGTFAGYIGSTIDVTDRKEAEAALHESEERFRLVANTAPVMIWMSGVDKLCTYFNQGWLEFTGRSLEAELGTGWAEGVHAEDLQRCLDTYTQAFDRREPFQMEYRLRSHDGYYRWIFDSGVPRFNADGSFAGYIGSCIDVTERKLAEDALSTVSQKLVEAHEEERNRIARELHDDINQRLALLAVNLEGLQKNPRSSTGEIMRGIAKASKQVEDIASDVQALSHRLHSSKLEYLGLAAAVAGLCRELCDRQGVEIDLHSANVPKELPKEISLCLFRVLQEALQNATKHSGSRRFQVSLIGRSNEIELEVQDSGIGFVPEEAIRGRGLGLTSIRERLRLVSGDLSIDSQPQRGTTVRARVPVGHRMKAAGASE